MATLGAVCCSGRPYRCVPSLSNSHNHRRRSEDLGVKVTRKKSYNVSTFRGAELPPPPIHYLLRRLRTGQSASVKRPVGRADPPMGLAAALTHVAAAAQPLTPPLARRPMGARRGRGWRR